MSQSMMPKVTFANVADRIYKTAAIFVVLGTMLFLAAGRLNWTEAWVFLGIYLLISLAGAVWLLYRDPDLSVERWQGGKNAKHWDQILVSVYGILTVILWLVVGLDAGRYGWSTIPLWLRILAGLGFIPSFGLSIWASSVNTYLSSRVRIQAERGHHTVTVGPYRVIRHPMYAGMLIYDVCLPLLLGSGWALVVSGLMIAVLVIRTVLEDKVLQAELAGYPEYTGKVHYRLVPGIW